MRSSHFQKLFNRPGLTFLNFWLHQASLSGSVLDRLFFQKHSVRPDMLNNNLPGVTFGMFGQARLHFQETFLRPRLIFRKPQVSFFFYVDKASETSIQIHFMILFVRSEYAFTAKFILKKQKRIKYRNELWRLSVPKYVQPSLT